MMATVDPSNAEQVAYWNGRAAEHWTERQEVQDLVLAPITRLLFAAANIGPGERVIDVGCGCGDTTLQAAEHVGPKGRALGVDVSQLMLSRAADRGVRLANVEFALADATAEDFSGFAADIIISRFGVMFFADPAVTFANLRRGLKPGGRLAFVCWREPKLNPWLTMPFQAMRHRVPPPPERGPDDPGPFAFADDARIRGILDSAGFVDIEISGRALELDSAVGRGMETAVATALEIGPVSRALDGQPDSVRSAAKDDIRTALQPYLKENSVWLGASVWVVTATSR